jgi:sugar lactone lactonase YvrE
MANCTAANAQVISADNLTPFQPRDVGTTSDAKTVRIKLNRAIAISSIGIAPGITEFATGTISGCVVDGHTVNPGLSVCVVEVTFSPQYPGLRTAPLVVTDSAGSKSSVGLVGTGLAPQAALTPGIITTIAGNGTAGFSGDGGPATEAELNSPSDGKFDWAGNLYIADSHNQRIRKVDRNGIITTVAVKGGYLFALALDAAGNIYFTTNGYHLTYVYKVDLNGVVTIFAGNGTSGYSGDGGPATEAELGFMWGLAADAAGNVYISDGNNGVIRKVDTQGIITSIVSNLNSPRGLAVDAVGNLYIADQNDNFILKVGTNGLTIIAGNGKQGFSGDGGPATQAELNLPWGVAVDAAGNVYIADAGNNGIRRVDTNGTIKTIALCDTNGTYPPACGVTTDPSGMLYAIEPYDNLVLKVDVSQSAVNFASQSVGTVSPSQQVTVTNTGNQHIEFTGLSLTGDFGQLTGTKRDCTDTTFLGVGYSCALRITFKPTTAGSLTGSATVTDNSLSLPGTMQTISLTGTGVNP